MYKENKEDKNIKSISLEELLNNQKKQLLRILPNKSNDEALKKEGVLQPVFIPKKYVKKIKAKPNYFGKVTIYKFNVDLFIPFWALRETSDGAGYVGKLKSNHFFSCQISFRGQINSSLFLEYFPREKTGRTYEPKK